MGRRNLSPSCPHAQLQDIRKHHTQTSAGKWNKYEALRITSTRSGGTREAEGNLVLYFTLVSYKNK